MSVPSIRVYNIPGLSLEYDTISFPTQVNESSKPLGYAVIAFTTQESYDAFKEHAAEVEPNFFCVSYK